MTLYRKYRPQKFSEVLGQEKTIETLSKQLEKNKLHHAYIFTGPKGTGKTSTARILAKAVNCLSSAKSIEPCNKCKNCLAIAAGNFLDLIEIDAASNRGIDDVRELRESVRHAPSSGKYKVYIIDEAHMLTAEAFNALLKTLEEPPPHALFILATTEPHKLPGTIISRSQKFNFERPDVAKIQKRLGVIVKSEGWKIEGESLAEIAKAADGAFRDAEVLLERIASVNPKAKSEEVLNIIGKKNASQVLEILEICEDRSAKNALIWLDDYVVGGGNVRVLNEAVLDTLRKILLIQVGADEKLSKELTSQDYTALKTFAESIDSDRLRQMIKLFTRSVEELAMATIPQLPLELALVEACEFQTAAKSEKVVRVDEQETQPDTKVTDPVEDAQPVKLRTTVSEEKLFKGVKKNWQAILKEVAKQNKSLAMFLRASSLDRAEDESIFLKFYYRFHKDRVEEPKNRSIVEGVIEKIVAAPVRIKGIMGGKPPEKVTTKGSKVVEKQEIPDPTTIFGQVD